MQWNTYTLGTTQWQMNLTTTLLKDSQPDTSSELDDNLDPLNY